MNHVSNNNKPIAIDYDAASRLYHVSYDVDGDGVADAAASETISEAEANARFFDSMGLHATNGRVLPSGGAALGATAGDGLGAPLLTVHPGVHTGQSLSDPLVWAEELSAGWLNFDALLTLAEGGRQDIILSRRLRNHLQAAKINAKHDEIHHTAERIAYDRDAAWVKFGATLAGTVVSGTIGYVGVSGSANRMWMTTAAQAAGQLVQTGVDAVDKQFEWAPQRKANEAQLNTQRAQLAQEAFDQAIDDSRSNEDESREMFRQALRLVTEHLDRQTDIVRKTSSF